MLAFRPDTTDISGLFTHAVVPMYTTSNFLATRKLLHDELKGYKNVCAIDSDNQEDRIGLVAIAKCLGFSFIELDEQLSRDTLTVEELDELKSHTSLPIGVTSVFPPIITLMREGLKPSFVCIECYDSLPDPAYAREEIKDIPIYGVVNFADLTFDSAKPDILRRWSREVWSKWDGIWFWGWETFQFDDGARQNYHIVRGLVQEFCAEEERSMVVRLVLDFIKRLFWRFPN